MRDGRSRDTTIAAQESGNTRSILRIVNAWDRFWFTPMRPHTLCALRIATGAMLLYCHLVLAKDLFSFVGPNAWINNEMARQLHDGAFGVNDWSRSYLWHLESPFAIGTHHVVTVVVTAMFLLGLLTRLTAPLALVLQLMYVHRLTGALFGLDQIVTYATFYLALTPCGSRYSIDAWIEKRVRGKKERSRFWALMFPDDSPSVAANIGTRLFQLHVCVIYLFGGLAKARGETWWDGTAVWYAISNFEYQTIDMTWMARYPALISALSNATLFWEVFYCALIWPRVTRPFVIAVAIAVHGGIALFLGMATFGLMMIAANAIFVSPYVFLPRSVRDADREQWFGDRDEWLDLDDESELDDADLSEEAELAEEEARYAERERIRAKKRKVRDAASRVKRRYRALKKREEKYESRVKKLREREAKIKDLVMKRREKKEPNSDDPDSDPQA